MSTAPLKVEGEVRSKDKVNINADLLFVREFVLHVYACMHACLHVCTH